MKKSVLLFLSLFALMMCSCGQSQQEIAVGSPCEDCELMLEGMPGNISWQTLVADASEPGEPMMISGVIFQADGTTPAPGVLLYVYHTDNKGIYSPSSNQTKGRRHGHLRGWMKTDAQGRYQFKTIRPASYPSRQAPQHVHPLIKEPGKSIYWIDEYLFEDDPLLTTQERSRQEKRGGSGIIALRKDRDGVWIGKRDIILGKNVPNYK